MLSNSNYPFCSAKRVVAAWRVLVGVWLPKRFDLSLSALSQYTTPQLPPENPWIDRSRVRSRSSTPGPYSPSASNNAPLPESPLASVASTPTATPSVRSGEKKLKRRRRPPSRKLIRHVLRARIEAAKALSSLFGQLEKAPSKSIRASSHLVRAYGGTLDSRTGALTLEGGDIVIEEPAGWRSAREVLDFLKKRGAKIGGLEREFEGEWAAALSSDGEGTEGETE